nr:cupin domain-containing protein [Tropicimonas sp. IMCC34043]
MPDPVLDLAALPVRTGSIYPEPYAAMMKGRSSLRLGAAGGLTRFGANLVRLEPGALSSLRHWHAREDEFAMVTDGICTLIDDAGAHAMRPGDCAAFPAGDGNGHHFVNRTDSPAAFLVLGARMDPERAVYSDLDLVLDVRSGEVSYTLKDGSPYPGAGR